MRSAKRINKGFTTKTQSTAVFFSYCVLRVSVVSHLSFWLFRGYRGSYPMGTPSTPLALKPRRTNDSTVDILGDFSVRAEPVEAVLSLFKHNHFPDDIRAQRASRDTAAQSLRISASFFLRLHLLIWRSQAPSTMLRANGILSNLLPTHSKPGRAFL